MATRNRVVIAAPVPEVVAPTMVDVAKVARVSHMTVSRVLNDQSSVRPETRERVLAAITQLGYRRNVAARTLVTGRTQMLGVVTLDSALYGPSSMLYSVEQAARAEGYFVAVVGIPAIDRASVGDAISRLADHGVDGIFVIAPLTSASVALAGVARDIPIVAVEGESATDIAVVSVDQVGGARAATKHLLELGHDTVWHIAGPHDWFEARDRLAGWNLALQEADIAPPPTLVGDWTSKSGYEAGRLAARMPDITAVFCANDEMALGLMLALREAGRDVPRDVSVVGFDDVPGAAYFSPPLTTIRQDFGAVGRRGLELLLEQLETGVARLEPVVIPSELIVRHSTESSCR